MKKKFGSFLLLLALVAGWSSCSDNNAVEDGTGGQDSTATNKTTIEIVQGNGEDPTSGVYATSADFTLNLDGVSQYAYVAIPEDSLKGKDLTGQQVFLQAQENGDSVYTAKKGANNVTLYGLDGGTKYTAFFGFKAGNQYEVKKQSFETPTYSRRITVVNATWDSYKVHFEVPDTMYYRYTIMLADMYYSMKEQFGNNDHGYLEYGSQVNKGPLTVEMKSGNLTDPDDPESVMGVYPGYRYVVILGECDEDGNLYDRPTEGGGTDPGPLYTRPDLGDYSEKYPDWDSEYYGWYARQDFWTRSPEIVQNQLTINKQRITERHAIYDVTPNPDDDLVGWGAMYLTEEEYEHYKSWTGDKGISTYLLINSQVQSGPQTLSIPIEKGEKYKLLVWGVYNNQLTKLSVYSTDFEPITSTKPIPKLTVEQVNTGDPWSLTYRVKCEGKNCTSLRYLMNDTKEWAKITDKETLFNSMAVDVSDASEIAKVNSDEGLEMTFASDEGVQGTLAVAGLNEDEAQSEIVYKDATAPEETGTPIQSSLFTDLAGEWTASMTYLNASGDTVKNGKFKVIIGGNPASDAPSSFTSGADYDKLVQYYVKYRDMTEAEAKAEVADQFKQFQERASHYVQKYRNLNRLVIEGFAPLSKTYKGPWALFNDTGYSSYDVNELFYDYGPKLFLQIGKDESGKDTLALFTNPNRVAPMMAWDYFSYYMFGYGPEGQNYTTPFTFKAAVSSDKKTITISGSEYQGKMFYPSAGYFYSGNVGAASRGLSGITLTKGWKDDGSTSFGRFNWGAGSSSNIKPSSGNGHYRRTKLLERAVHSPVELKQFKVTKESLTAKPKVFKWK